MNRKFLTLAITGALSVPLSPLFAQQNAEDDMMLEEVTVTARKRQETLQDVPFSVAARTEQQMRESGLVSIEDVSRTVASFTVQNLGPGQSQVAIRGASAGQIVRDHPGIKEQVGVYLDESVISLSLFTPDIDLFDMNRVEVLRGPQGTLYGSGSLSGTVRYITNQPDDEAFSSAAEGNLNTIDNGGSGGYAKAYVNSPIGDTAAVRVAAWYNDTPGWIAAHQPDGSITTDVNDGTTKGLRAAMRFEAGNLIITPRVIYQKVETDGWNRQDAYNILGNPYTTTRPAVTLGEHEQYTQFEEPFTDEFTLLDLNLEYEFGNGMVLNSITSYTDRDILVVRDATALTASITGGSIGLPEEVYTLNAPLDDGTQASGWTQELRLSGETGNFTWVGGMFYSDFERDYGQGLLVSGFDALFCDVPGCTKGSFIAPVDGLYWSDLSYDFKQLAVFGEATWAMTDAFDLTLGLRYYDFDESRVQTFDGIFADPGTTYGDTTADGFAPRLMADWALTDDLSINGQVSKGFRLGGINDPLNVPLCTPQDLETFGGRENWDDEELWNYEVGMKSLFMGGRGTFNVAVFYQDIKDLQATVTAGSCSSRVVFNVPKAHSAGIEMELAMQATERFDFALTGSFIEAKLDSTVTSTQSDGSVVVVGGIKDGNRLATVPELQAAAAANYVFPMMGEWEGYLNGIVQYVGDRYTQIGDQAEGFGTVNLLSFEPNTIGGPLTQSTFTFNPLLPSYTVANARFGMRNGRWDVALYVNNLTDELAYLALDQERGTRARVGYLVNQPRTYGITARVSF
jgi:iron complex outermembrane receptor protein